VVRRGIGKENFNDTVVVKTLDAKLKRKTLAVPNLEGRDVSRDAWTATFNGAENFPATVRTRACPGIHSDGERAY